MSDSILYAETALEVFPQVRTHYLLEFDLWSPVQIMHFHRLDITTIVLQGGSMELKLMSLH